MGVFSESRAKSPSDYNYLLLSDVHLGAGLVSHVRPWAHDYSHRCTEVDVSIASCLDHYEGERPDGKPWRLIIAGDFIDFIGMALPLPAEAELPSGVTAEERAHGLGSAADHAVRKLRAAAELHHVAFTAIARFLASGNQLVLVRGNHDVDFHWSEVQRAFVDLLHEHSPAHIRRDALRRSVRFCPWFYYEPELLYVEHGHEFDPMCSYGDPLSPVCPRDPRRIRWTPSDVMLRYVARPTPGLSTSQHEQGTVASYLRLVASLGIGGGARLILRFIRATARLIRDSFHHQSVCQGGSAARLGRLFRYAKGFRVDEATVRAMVDLYATPATHTPWGLAERLYLDRLAMLMLAAWLAAVALGVGAAGTGWDTGWSLGAAVMAAALALISSRTGSRNDDPGSAMKLGASRIAELFPARYVVMGHTHHPVAEPLRRDVSYVNLGHWGQDDLPEDLPGHVRPPCSHLVILTQASGVRAELRSWDPQRGHRPYLPDVTSEAPDEATGVAPALC